MSGGAAYRERAKPRLFAVANGTFYEDFSGRVERRYGTCPALHIMDNSLLAGHLPITFSRTGDGLEMRNIGHASHSRHPTVCAHPDRFGYSVEPRRRLERPDIKIIEGGALYIVAVLNGRVRTLTDSHEVVATYLEENGHQPLETFALSIGRRGGSRVAVVGGTNHLIGLQTWEAGNTRRSGHVFENVEVLEAGVRIKKNF